MNKYYFKISLFNLLIVLVISIIFSYLLSNILYRIPAYEKIEVFISSSYIDEEVLIDRIDNIENIKEINIIPRSINNNYYEDTLQTIGLYSDILIIPTSYLDTKEKAFSFSSIDESYFSSYNININDYELISYDDSIYGIIVYDKEKNIDLFKDIIVFENDDRYVLCIGKYTPNVMNEPKSNKETNNAFKVFMELIK